METNERLRLSAHNEGLSAAKAPRYHDNFLLRLGPSLIVRLLTIVCAANRINRGACCRRQEKREHNRCRAVCGLLCWTQVYRARRVWEFTSEAQQSQDRIIYWQSFDQIVAVGVELSHKHIEFQWHAGPPHRVVRCPTPRVVARRLTFRNRLSDARATAKLVVPTAVAKNRKSRFEPHCDQHRTFADGAK